MQAVFCKKRGSAALAGVPEYRITAETCLAAVSNDGNALQFVPEGLKTPEICLAAVKLSGMALWCVPENFKTAELCLAAARQSGWALMSVPEKLKTFDICLAAVSSLDYVFDYVPEELKDAVASAKVNLRKYIKQGDAFYREKNFAASADAYDRALAIKDYDPVLYRRRAKTYAVRGDYEQALADLNRAIALAPNNGALYKIRGLVYDKLGEHEKSLVDYNKAKMDTFRFTDKEVKNAHREIRPAGEPPKEY
jgi:tetratricopeptide (TPR) repeat protein